LWKASCRSFYECADTATDVSGSAARTAPRGATVRACVLAAALAISIVGLFPPCLDAQTAIPFTRTVDGFVLIPVSVGEADSIQLIFDTGSGIDVLAPSIIQRLHGRPAGTFTGFRMYGDRIDIPLFVIPTLSIGPVVRKSAVVGSWDVLDSLHVAGTIAANDFRNQPFTLDFVHGVMTFEAARSLASRRSAGTPRPLLLDDARGLSLDLFAKFLVAADSGVCDIDTGSPMATIGIRTA